MPDPVNPEMDAIILCGGAGLRLRPVVGTGPKSMASVSGRPFLELLLRQLQRYGFERAILAIGYRGAEIESHFGAKFGGMDLLYSNEISPLGTAGALRNAAAQVRSASCLAMNGDSYTAVDLAKFAAAHRASQADVSVVIAPVDERSDCGCIELDGAGNLVQFLEKAQSPAARYLNAGVYALALSRLIEMPAGVAISLEREMFPRWIRRGLKVKGFVYSGKCIDIGTPDRYRVANEVLAGAEALAGEAREGDVV
jgi:NDP-sugar pyrophosphorylase family protein